MQTAIRERVSSRARAPAGRNINGVGRRISAGNISRAIRNKKEK